MVQVNGKNVRTTTGEVVNELRLEACSSRSFFVSNRAIDIQHWYTVWIRIIEVVEVRPVTFGHDEVGNTISVDIGNG